MAGQPLTGRVVVITGASAGIGRQLAIALGHAGAQTVIAARRFERLEELARELPNCVPVACDVTNSEDRQVLIAAAIDHFGKIDGLINNAGLSIVEPAMTASVDDFAKIIDLNLTAPFALSQLAAREMKQSGGSIVNIASIVGLRATRLPTAGYTASKAGLLGLTRELATQWARYNIRVNAIAPGWFETELTGPLFEGNSTPDWISAGTPLGRAGVEGELDGAAIFLLSDQSTYVTGHTLVVDGGLTAA